MQYLSNKFEFEKQLVYIIVLMVYLHKTWPIGETIGPLDLLGYAIVYNTCVCIFLLLMFYVQLIYLVKHPLLDISL